MGSSHCFREFLNERLSAAAEEIFRMFEQTVLEYQEEISRQRRLLDRAIQPESKLQQKDIFQVAVGNEEIHVDKKSFCDQEGLAGLDLNELDVSQIKEEEELWTSVEEEQNIAGGQETHLSELNLTGKGRNHSDHLPLLLESQGSEEESPSNVSVLVIKTESDREDSAVPLHSHRDLKQEGISAGQPADKKLLKCSYCPKKVSDFMKLKIHLRTHSGEKLFQCDTCGKSFTKMALLKKHTITHTGLKPFICEVCGKKFNFSSNRDTHMKTHSMEKPHTCDVCGKAFRRSADLKRHSRCHTGEKPYSCSFCGQVFPYHTSLKNHLRRHTGEKPYRCVWCGKGFALNSTMKIHTRIHTGERPYKCNACGITYAHKTGLNEHKKFCHLWQKQNI